MAGRAPGKIIPVEEKHQFCGFHFLRRIKRLFLIQKFPDQCQIPGFHASCQKACEPCSCKSFRRYVQQEAADELVWRKDQRLLCCISTPVVHLAFDHHGSAAAGQDAVIRDSRTVGILRHILMYCIDQRGFLYYRCVDRIGGSGDPGRGSRFHHRVIRKGTGCVGRPLRIISPCTGFLCRGIRPDLHVPVRTVAFIYKLFPFV